MRAAVIAAFAAILSPAEAMAQAAAPSAAGLGQTLLALAVVVGSVFALAWLARRSGLPGRGAQNLMRSVAALSVGVRERVVVVEIGDSWLVLGVTAQNVTLLQNRAKGTLPKNAAAPLAGGFAHLLKQAARRHEQR